MILVKIPIVIAGVASIAAILSWSKNRKLRKKEKKALQSLQNISEGIRIMEERRKLRQQQHEDDLNGVIVNLETGQTAEEVESGIFPKKYASKQVKKTKEDDMNEVNDRFEILDL